MRNSWAFLRFLFVAFLQCLDAAMDVAFDLDCDPCIDRESYLVKVIVHGTAEDGFWQQVQKASLQAGEDLRVQLDFNLYENFSNERMVQDILDAASLAAAKDPEAPSALVVSIPSPEAEEAIKEAQNYIPIFGMNSGYDKAQELGVLGFVAMDEYLGGRYAVDEFLMKGGDISRALFVNHAQGVSSTAARYKGFVDAFAENSTRTEVEELAIDLTDPYLAEIMKAAFVDCPYDAILAAGASAFQATKAAMLQNGCDFTRSRVAAFDTDASIFNDIAVGTLSFAISQQQYLQGSLSVALAAIYATTGNTLARSSQSEYGIYYSGPNVINIRNLPSDTQQICEAEAFPVCNRQGSRLSAETDSSFAKCPCTDRSKIKIGGVVHGVTTDTFWDVIFEQANQAADDLGVELLLDRLEPQPNATVWHTKMARKMASLCQGGVDGLFVSIPSDQVVAAIEECRSLNVPVISINSGAKIAEEIGLIHHISQIEYAAGRAAGERLADSGIEEALCINAELGNVATAERCRGFLEVMVERNVTNLGVVETDRDTNAATRQAIEDFVGRSDDWEGLGILNVISLLTDVMITLKESHPSLRVGSFDLSNSIFEGLDSGALEFSIDQNPFVQGYMPVWLLAVLASTKQHLENRFIESGPTLITSSPSEPLQQCTENNFEVCERPVDVIYEDNLLDPGILIFGHIAMVTSCVLSLYFLVWIYRNQHLSIVQASQPEFLALICIGAFISSSTLMALSFQAESGEDTSKASMGCVIAPFLYTTGWILMFGSLCGKTFRIFKIMENCSHDKQKVVSFYKTLKLVIVAMVVDLTIIISWTLVNPLEYKREELSRNVDAETGTITVDSIGYCTVRDEDGPGFWAFGGPVIGFHLALMGATNVLLYKVRRMKDRYQESKYIGFAMLLMLETLAVGIPIAVAVDDPKALHVVLIGIIAVHDIGVLSLLFFPKILFKPSSEENANMRKEDSVILASLRKVSNSKFGEAMEVLDEVAGDSVSNGLTERQRSQLRLVKTLLLQRNSHDNDKMYLPAQLYVNRSSNIYILREFGGVLESDKDTTVNSFKTGLSANLESAEPQDMKFYVLPEFDALPESQRRNVFRLLSWSNLKQWDFSVFDVAQVTDFNPLLFVGWAVLGSPYSQYAMAKACGYNDVSLGDFKGYHFASSHLKIPMRKLCDYLRAVEADYNNTNPYHNATHAADVVQTLHAFIQMKADEFVDVEELFSILLAAVVHDVKHPGKNNAFQVNAKTNVALVYNDKSVLENKHAAHAFMLMLRSSPEDSENIMDDDWEIPDLNVLANVDDAKFASIRKRVVEAVLQTDMSKHFANVNEMRALFEDAVVGDTVILGDESRWDLLSFMLHVADISNPAKGHPLFHYWTDRCLEEFFAQGDAEDEMGLQISPNCNRKTTKRAASQIGFIKFVVRPSFEVLALAVPEIQERILPQIEKNMLYWIDIDEQERKATGISKS